MVNAERVSRAGSCAVGADRGGGGGLVDEKPEMAQSTMQDSRSALEMIRSL